MPIIPDMSKAAVERRAALREDIRLIDAKKAAMSPKAIAAKKKRKAAVENAETDIDQR